MRIVDTSAWVEWLMQSSARFDLDHQFPVRGNHLAPTMVQLELAVWAKRELTSAKARGIIAFTMRCIVLPLDSKIALRAADERREHKLATADAIIYTTALAHDADLLTCDAHFKSLPGVVNVPKIAS